LGLDNGVPEFQTNEKIFRTGMGGFILVQVSFCRQGIPKNYTEYRCDEFYKYFIWGL